MYNSMPKFKDIYFIFLQTFKVKFKNKNKQNLVVKIIIASSMEWAASYTHGIWTIFPVYISSMWQTQPSTSHRPLHPPTSAQTASHISTSQTGAKLGIKQTFSVLLNNCYFASKLFFEINCAKNSVFQITSGASISSFSICKKCNSYNKNSE